MTRTAPLHLFGGHGVELEYMIVDAHTLSVLPVADKVLYAFAGEYTADIDLDGVALSNELALHVIEIKSNGPIEALAALVNAFDQSVADINAVLAAMGGRLMPSAMHPWMDPVREMRLWPHSYNPIYEAFNRIFDCRSHGWTNLQSTHLNLPFADDDEFARLHAAIRLLLPILPALAASSPLMDARMTGKLDNRLDVYRHNAQKIPSITGMVIPEPIFSPAVYQEQLLAELYRDIAPFDSEGILQEEWLNARGAIARFERNTIEIRVVDAQECPRADVAICAAIVAVLRTLVDETWTDLASQQSWETEPLAAILFDTIAMADNAVIHNGDYLRALGFRQTERCTAGELWHHLIDTCFVPTSSAENELYTALQLILRYGTLARRLHSVLGENPDQVQIAEVYRELCNCLADGRMFFGAP